MNILLCVTGFFVCFSSFGMNDANKQKEHEPIVSIVSQPELSGGESDELKEDRYIKKDDPEAIGVALSAIDRKLFEFRDRFFNTLTIKYLDFNVIMQCNDISRVVFSFYYLYIIEDRHDEKDSLTYIAQDTLNQDKTDYLTQKYKENMLKMISYLEEKKYHRLASLFLKEYFSNEKLQTPGVEYNILSCYQYVLNQMEMRENVDVVAIDKPQITETELRDIMIFLEEKKYHNLTNALFSEYGPNKVLDANVFFMYDMGCGEKACTPVALSVLYTLRELAERNKGDELGIKCEDLKKYLLDNVLISKSVPILNKCIANTQGSRQQSLISLKENINQYALGHRYFEHLYNEIMQYREEIKLRSHKEDVLCVEIMNWMLYYQAQ